MRYLVLALIVAACATRESPLTVAPAKKDGVLQKSLGLSAAPLHVRSGDSVPERGRSDFDLLFARSDGQETRVVVPWPFDELIRRLGGPDKVAYAMIPRGRSLQRKSASPHFFKAPRVVINRDYTFVGHVEGTEMLEVISFNREMGRFEFQIVEDYSEKGARTVKQADRGLCVSCHHDQTPIFSLTPWEETAGGSEFVADALMKEHGEKYFGLDTGRTPKSIRGVAAFDDAVEKGNQLVLVNRVWRDGCGRDAADSKTCRQLAERLAREIANGFCLTENVMLGNEQCPLDSLPEDDLDKLHQYQVKYWPEYWPTGLAIPNPKVANRSIEVERGDPSVDGAMAPEFSPLSPRGSRGNLVVTKDKGLARWLVRGLAMRVFREGKLKVAELPRTPWAPFLVDEVKKKSQDPDLQLFVDYCGRCHLRAIPWLGDEDGVPQWSELAKMSERIVEKLNWVENPPSGWMPPSNTLEYETLRKRPDDLKRMQELALTCAKQECSGPPASER